MQPNEKALVDRYLDAVGRGLRGMPREDVADTLEEIRTHLFEEIGERGDASAVLTDFGDAAEVASDIVTRRVRPDDGRELPQASLGRRYSAWATDVVIGFGPMLLVPTAVTFLSWMFGLWGADGLMPVWIQISEHVAHWWLSALGYTGLTAPSPVPLGQWLLAALLVSWAVFYWLWLRRTLSASAGMWMAGLTALRVNDDRLVVRLRDVAQHPSPLGSEHARWWILLPAIPAGCLCILLLLYYLWMCIGPFLPPRILGS
jgi:hypothetical protein